MQGGVKPWNQLWWTDDWLNIVKIRSRPWIQSHIAPPKADWIIRLILKHQQTVIK